MEREKLLLLLKDGETDFLLMAQEKNDIIKDLMAVEREEPSALKYDAEKAVREISERSPELFLGFQEEAFSLLESENTFIRLGNIITCSNLAALGTDEIFGLLKEKYVPFLYSKSIAEFGNAAAGVPKIIAAFPSLERELVAALLDSEKRTFIHKGEPSEECRRVAAGKVSEVFIKICENSPCRSEIEAFARRNLTNTRSSARRKAEKLLKKLKG